jgi:hypothetical protein
VTLRDRPAVVELAGQLALTGSVLLAIDAAREFSNHDPQQGEITKKNTRKWSARGPVVVLFCVLRRILAS